LFVSVEIEGQADVAGDADTSVFFVGPDVRNLRISTVNSLLETLFMLQKPKNHQRWVKWWVETPKNIKTQ